jgi:hypothetical protein
VNQTDQIPSYEYSVMREKHMMDFGEMPVPLSGRK